MKIFLKGYFFLIFFSIYFHDFSAIDMKAPQWLSLSIINLVYLSSIIVKYNKRNIFKDIYSNQFFKYFLYFLIAALLSTIWAINQTESLVRLTDLFCIISTLAISTFIYKEKLITLNYLIGLFVFSLVLDVLGSLNSYRAISSLVDYNYNLANDIRGFYGNKNITSAALAFKIPFAVFLFLNQKSNLYKFLLLVLIFSSFYVIFLLTARAVFLSIIACMFFLLLVLFIGRLNNKNFKIGFKNSLVYIIPLFISLTLFNLTEGDESSLSIQNRVETITSQGDESISQRLRFYSHTLKQFSQTPLFGIGIGNWKIVSIKYDAENIYSYVVPYFAHNDLLEILAETGILGFIPFFVFILCIFKINLKNIINYIYGESVFNNVFLSLPFIVYFIDMNLNFPLDRPSMQIFLITYIIIIQIIIDNENERISS